MKYIHYFGSESDFNQERESNYIEPWVSYTVGKGVDYNKNEQPIIDYTKIPFTIEALGSGSITWALGTKTVSYSKNDGAWETMDSATTISVVEGDEVQFRGANTDYSGNTISSTSQFNVKGNIMSLADVDDSFERAVMVNANCFTGLFSGCIYLVSACDLKLPATALSRMCYQDMFNGCTSLTTAPELPATKLENYCYWCMFKDCTSLTTAPELPATTLASYCYQAMFHGCTSLTTAPELPATTLKNYCYNGMFKECTSLTTVPELPATTLAINCYSSMFFGCTNLNYIKAMFTTTPSTTYTSNWVNGVSSTGTFVKNSAATWTTTGVNGIPTGWTVQTATE